MNINTINKRPPKTKTKTKTKTNKLSYNFPKKKKDKSNLKKINQINLALTSCF